MRKGKRQEERRMDKEFDRDSNKKIQIQIEGERKIDIYREKDGQIEKERQKVKERQELRQRK